MPTNTASNLVYQPVHMTDRWGISWPGWPRTDWIRSASNERVIMASSRGGWRAIVQRLPRGGQEDEEGVMVESSGGSFTFATDGASSFWMLSTRDWTRHTLRERDLDDGTPLRSLDHLLAGVPFVAAASWHLATSKMAALLALDEGRVLRIFDLEREQALLSLRLPDDDFPNQGGFSPDGRHLSYWLEKEGSVHVINLDGTVACATVLKAQAAAQEHFWLDNDHLLVISRSAAEQRVQIALLDVARGTSQLTGSFPSQYDIIRPSLSPDGRKVLIQGIYTVERQCMERAMSTKPRGHHGHVFGRDLAVLVDVQDGSCRELSVDWSCIQGFDHSHEGWKAMAWHFHDDTSLMALLVSIGGFNGVFARINLDGEIMGSSRIMGIDTEFIQEPSFYSTDDRKHLGILARARVSWFDHASIFRP